MRKTLQYRFENFMARGGTSIFLSLVVLFLGALALMFFLRVLVLHSGSAAPDTETLRHHLWITLMEIVDPGSIEEEGNFPIIFKALGLITMLSGVVIFSMLIAFITARLENTLYQFRQGHSRVMERGHTVILGWNERIFDLLEEFITEGQTRRRNRIVILSEREKTTMDEELLRQIPSPPKTRIITRSGNPGSGKALEQISLAKARRVVILSRCSQNDSTTAKELADTRTLKTIMAVNRRYDQGRAARKQTPPPKKEPRSAPGPTLPVIAEIHQEEKRALVRELSYSAVEPIVIDFWKYLGRLMIQTSLNTGLEQVYEEILSFRGSEFYFTDRYPGGIPFGELLRHYRTGIPCGILSRDGRVDLVPAPSRIPDKTQGDKLLLLAQNRTSAQFSESPLFQPQASQPAAAPTARQAPYGRQDILIIGWHNAAPILLEEYPDYIPAQSRITFLLNQPSRETQDQIRHWKKASAGRMEISILTGDPLSSQDLAQASPFTRDSIIILARNEGELNSEKIDGETLVTLLLLREIRKNQGDPGVPTTIITQLLNSENEDLIRETKVDDFLISNRMMTMMTAQMAVNPQNRLLFEELFQESGREIYLKPLSLYLPPAPAKPAVPSFLDLAESALRREEVCLGYMNRRERHNPAANYGIRLNPPRTEHPPLRPQEDYLIVMAEDER